MSEKSGLGTKRPVFETVRDFRFEQLKPIFDYALVFSVLNHCTVSQREAFFRKIPEPLKKGGRVYVSHASWFDEAQVEGSGMRLGARFGSRDFNIAEYGWEDPEEIFPIIELTRTG
jgi:hypothetical protein